MFQSLPREIPSLCRGWRTPDPSPSRNLGEKPAPVMTIVEEALTKLGDHDAPQIESPLKWDYALVRTPSQSPGKVLDFHAQDEVMTPRGHGPDIGAWDVDGLISKETRAAWQQAVQEPLCAPKDDERKQTIPTYAPRAQVSPLLLSDTLPENGDRLQYTNPATTCKGHFCESFAAAVAARPQPKTHCSDQQGMPASTCLRSDCHRPGQSEQRLKAETTNQNPKPLVSQGSIGHPYSCAEACKYAKKRKGCKDGALCDHCHLCTWKRYENGRAACRASARSKWEC